MNTPKQRYPVADKLWDLWCLISIIGIWPRFIEPNVLITKYLTLKVPKLPAELQNIKILTFSDLHFNHKTPQWHLTRLINKIAAAQPDLIFFTGDFINAATLEESDRLLNFLNTLPRARYGNFAVLGNHDYSSFLALNDNGDYDALSPDNSSLISKGFRRLFDPPSITGNVTPQATKTPPHAELLALLKKTPFQLLHNETIRLNINGATLNICGFGEYMAGQTIPIQAFANYDRSAPGILLLHNPDAIPLLKNFPGDIILCGHTHGGQINLPWICQRLALMEHPSYKRGLIKENGKQVYITRGVGAVMTFRWFSLPEMLILKLQ